MGVIIRQSFKSTIVNLVGALIGVISILYIYPLHQGANGFANSILYNSMFIATFVSFGVNIVAVRFFYEVKKNDHYAKSGFLLFLLIFILINFLLVLIFSFYFKDVIYEKLEVLKFNSKIFSSNEGIILFLSLIMVLINLLNAYASIYGRIVIPTLVNNLGFKIFLPILIILVYYSLIDYTQLSNYLLLYHMMVFVFLLFYLRSLNALDVNLKFMNFGKPKIVEMANFSLLTGLTGIGSFLSTKIDIPIISGFLGYEATGNYAIPLMMTAVMEIPNTSVISIASPILSKAWNDNNIKSIQEIYEKSSINLLLIGCFMFISVWFCFDSLSHLSVNPKVFEDTKVVFFVLGIAKLIDMVTGVNNQIIGYSSYFRFNLYFVVATGLINLLLSFYLIPIYGIIGAAISVLITVIIFNIIKLYFIYSKIGIHPFSFKTLILLGIGLFVGFLLNIIPPFQNDYLNIVLRLSIISVTYLLLIYKCRVSHEFEIIAHDFMDKVLKKSNEK